MAVSGSLASRVAALEREQVLDPNCPICMWTHNGQCDSQARVEEGPFLLAGHLGSIKCSVTKKSVLLKMWPY